jgi:hypothetical protein
MTCFPSPDSPGFLCGPLPLATMTDPTDIIGIAKRWQEKLIVKDPSVRKVTVWRIDAKSIAQALLIAVEALEAESRQNLEGTYEENRIDFATESLSRIRSLPSHE